MSKNVKKNGVPPAEKKDWLVKASSQILGPFCFEDIHQLLKSSAITFSDEIRRSDQRWMQVNEHKDFAVIVQSLKFEHEVGELTMTSATPNSVNTHTDEFTRTDHIDESKDNMTLTPFIGTAPGIQPKPQNKSEQLKDITPLRESQNSQRPAHMNGKTFGLQNDLRLQREIETQSNSWRWKLLAVLLAVSLGFIGFQYYQGQKKNQEFDRYVRLAIRYKNLQLYEQSLLAYRRAQAIKEPDVSVQEQIAPLLIAYDGESLKGRRILEKAILSTAIPKLQKIESYVGIGLSYLMENNLKEAESSFNMALSYDRNHLAANMNLIWIKYTQKLYKEALDLIDSVQTPQQGLILLAEGLVLSEMDANNLPVDRIDSMIQKLSGSQRTSQFLRSEILLMMIYFQEKRTEYEVSVPFMKSVLDEPPRVQKFFIQDPLIFKKWMDANQWDKICPEIQNRFPNHALPKIVHAYCLQNLSKDMEASKLVNEALKQSPNDPYGMLQQLNLYMKFNKISEASVLIRKAELQNFRLPLWYQGKICLESGDFSCALSSFNSILMKKPSDIFARHGLASTYYKLGQKNEALSAIRAGLSDEPQFLPLLELRDVLENQ